MQSKTWFIVNFVLATVVLTGWYLNGGVNAKPSVSTSTSVSTHQAAPVIPAVPKVVPTVVQSWRSSDSPEMTAALSYLRSAPRMSKYNSIVPRAGLKIAKALDAGTFGPVKRYGDDKKPLKAGYTGWGGISSEDKGLFAWVFWKSDGSIDYTQPITQIAVNDAADPVLSQVSMFGPTSTDLSADRGTYWETYVAKSADKTMVVCTSGIQNPGNAHSSDTFVYPTTLDEIKAYDTIALEDLRYDMIKRFGSGWDK